MPSLTVENYLKTILQICVQSDSEWASTGNIATALGVSPGTVTSMLKTLSESRLAKYKPYSGVSLTKQGRTLAVRMLRRHRLLELFLVKTLDLTWDQVHEEAERMEHAVSDELIDRIDEFLGQPEVDPHGDPIPTADGTLTGEDYGIPLANTALGETVRIIRVRNQEPEFLRYLSNTASPWAKSAPSRKTAKREASSLYKCRRSWSPWDRQRRRCCMWSWSTRIETAVVVRLLKNARIGCHWPACPPVRFQRRFDKCLT